MEPFIYQGVICFIILLLFTLTKQNKKFGIPIGVLTFIAIILSYLTMANVKYLAWPMVFISIVILVLFIIRTISDEPKSFFSFVKIILVAIFFFGLVMASFKNFYSTYFTVYLITAYLLFQVFIIDRCFYYFSIMKKWFPTIIFIETIISIGFLLYAFDQQAVAVDNALWALKNNDSLMHKENQVRVWKDSTYYYKTQNDSLKILLEPKPQK